MKPLQIVHEGVVLFELDYPVRFTEGDVLYLNRPGQPTVPWPLDEEGRPLPIEFDPSFVTLS